MTDRIFDDPKWDAFAEMFGRIATELFGVECKPLMIGSYAPKETQDE